MGSSAGFMLNASAFTVGACASILPSAGAFAQTQMTAAAPVQLTAAGASLQLPETAIGEDTTRSERQPLRNVPPPAVRITIGAENADIGPVRYAVRSPVAGSAMAVSFAATPLLRGMGGPSVFPTMLPIATASLTSGFGMRYHRSTAAPASIRESILRRLPDLHSKPPWTKG